MFANLRRLILVHLALGLATIVVYWSRPGSITPPADIRDRSFFALSVIGMVLLAWAPYVVSGFYACNKLAERKPRATTAFSCAAVAIAVCAACFSVNLLGLQTPPSDFLVSLGTTIALIAAARVCAGIWQAVSSDPFYG